MATSTTNLGLTKPAGTDKIRIAQINGNMDILDEKIGAVGNTSLQAQVTSQNQAIAKLAETTSISSVTSISVLKTGLQNIADGLAAGGIVPVRFYCNFATDGFKQGYYYSGHLTNFYKSSGVSMYHTTLLSNSDGDEVSVGYSSGTWTITSVKNDITALNSKIVSNAITVTDFNDVITPGTYQARSSSTAINAPNPSVPGRWYNLSVFANADGEITQLAYSTSYGLAYIRGRTSGGAWTSWQELATKTSQTVTDTTNSSGQIISSLDFGNVISANVESTVDYYCLVRKSTAGKAVFIVCDGNFEKIANTSVSIKVWTA